MRISFAFKNISAVMFSRVVN
ncbi:unnamed protein product [Acanthoscelides obtectus]|uniref:Uncharacterized protein n=1 Tax=Acanthoscelides obtectus TaxID=200917 RepID=A0A9P0KDY4_ACAOB|nr:unnamed protein product [Acanthoscelides obtectus]CAK1683159.1 hypothetical protein AOBTE_LOCUS34112 [Acanthoscelides obtectus]